MKVKGVDSHSGSAIELMNITINLSLLMKMVIPVKSLIILIIN